jgi:hypothetical protein
VAWTYPRRPEKGVLEYATGNVYLDNVQFTSNSMSWEWAPRPWDPFPNNISGFLWAFWSEDGGLIYHGAMWDYITNTHTAKGLKCGMFRSGAESFTIHGRLRVLPAGPLPVA